LQIAGYELKVAGYKLQVADCGDRGVGMRSYRDLEIYKRSFHLAIEVHRLSLKLPNYELFEEGSQVRKSSKGVTACIVEGYGRRKYKADFVKFLTYSHASCDETIVHLKFISAIHEHVRNETDEFVESYEELGKQINKFISYVEKEWK
jgi:four helix bundle protein